MTDLLIDLADTALAGGDVESKINVVVNRYRAITDGLGLDNTITDVIAADLRERVQADRSNTDLFIDSIKASGEDNNAKLIASYFNSIGMPAKYVSPKEGLVVNDLPERTFALPEAYVNLSKLKETNEIIIFLASSAIQKRGFYVLLTEAARILQARF